MATSASLQAPPSLQFNHFFVESQGTRLGEDSDALGTADFRDSMIVHAHMPIYIYAHICPSHHKNVKFQRHSETIVKIVAQRLIVSTPSKNEIAK